MSAEDPGEIASAKQLGKNPHNRRNIPIVAGAGPCGVIGVLVAPLG
jgi:hypothetical protein